MNIFFFSYNSAWCHKDQAKIIFYYKKSCPLHPPGSYSLKYTKKKTERDNKKPKGLSRPEATTTNKKTRFASMLGRRFSIAVWLLAIKSYLL